MTQRQEIFDLIGGRIRMYHGRYNPTADAIWLAAAVADVRAKTVLDVGVGSGGVALGLWAYNNNLAITGIDTSPEMLELCAKNAKLNGVALDLILADISTWRTAQTFDLVVTNPPYFRGTPAAHNAHHNADLTTWVRRSVARVRPRGTFAIIVDAGAMATVIAAMVPTVGDINIYPLFGAKSTAERVIIRGRVGVRTGATLYPVLPMNYAPVLRDGLTVGDALSKLC